MPRNNRTAGNAYERKITNELKDLGFTDAVTSRAESRNMDAKKVDIFGDNVPFHVQCKNSKARISFPVYYKEVKDVIPTDKPFIMIHKKTKKAKTKFVSEGEYVYMTKEDFYKIISELKNK